MACANLAFQFSSCINRSNICTFGKARALSSGLQVGPKKGEVWAFSSPIGSRRPGIDENPEAIISGEWQENFSFLSFDDLRAYLEAHTDDESTENGPSSMMLGEVMSTSVLTATAEQTLEDVGDDLELVSVMPVVDGELRCTGVISKSDRAKASHELKSTVGEVMTSPAITLPFNKTVKDAATLMLKMKISMIPILNKRSQVIGIVTGDEISQALEAMETA
ncbi:uncharacterized protein A4U43_C01F7100 [Asparagus officinalis]|uniref:CBS domain-containing protein n=1 Tax=Asparagus officinalis TaxID=4686 RepID=A0A5P1FS26_ASPOF|nr:uncharacterized protein LOC109850629 [Asparagus officinalis]ONK79511.1 uncharacterized protein A4U43_C01F7100 [Asparagus officinalis]